MAATRYPPLSFQTEDQQIHAVLAAQTRNHHGRTYCYYLVTDDPVYRSKGPLGYLEILHGQWTAVMPTTCLACLARGG